MKPRFKLSRLREIGWQYWDPIGLGGLEHQPDDEYDTYLLLAAGRLWNGASQEEVVAYLIWTSTEDMGLAERPGDRERSTRAAKALAVYVDEIRQSDVDHRRRPLIGPPPASSIDDG